MTNPNATVWNDRKAFEAWLEDNSGTKANAQNLNLRQLDLSRLNLESAVFRQANLEEARFESSNLDKADFSRAQLAGTGFRSAHAVRAVFSDAKMPKVDLSGAIAPRAVFAKSVLHEADLSAGDFSYARFAEAQLVGASLKGADLRGISARGADFRRADFGGADLSNADLTGSRWNDTRIDRGTSFRSSLFAESHPAVSDGYDQIQLPRWASWFNWSSLKFVGRLPLFASASVLFAGSLFIATMIKLLNSTEFMQTLSYPVPIPEKLGILLLGSLLLTVGSLIYEVACPVRVQEYTLTGWVDELGRAGVLYLSDMIQRPLPLLLGWLTLGFGALITAYLFVERVWAASDIILQALAF